ncbi:MAG: sugar transferase [Anaerolineales bacterium]|jgi:exopolysaccharide biosynthesis polyprenyl glycosylphosphotransferase
MKTQRISPITLRLFLLDFLAVPTGIFLASKLRLLLPFGLPLPESSAVLPLTVYLLGMACWSGSLLANGVYDPERTPHWRHEFARIFISGIIATLLFAGVLFMTYRETSRLQFVYIFFLNLSLIYSIRLQRVISTGIRRRKGEGDVKVVIVGAGDLGQRLADVILEQDKWGYRLAGFLDDDKEKRNFKYAGVGVLGRIFEIRDVVESMRIDEIWVALPVWAYDRITLILHEVEKLPVKIKIVPNYFSLALVQARAELLGGIPLIGLREPVIVGVQRIIKRVFDLVIGSALLILSLPVMIMIGLAIRLEGEGPVIFRQARVGENGRIFQMYKFRTMVPDAEAKQNEVNQNTDQGQVIHKQMDDPRVTRVGHLLRRYSLDELPQLVNVLKGDMSLVGPRPEMPWLVDRYDSWQRKRFAVPQGITGWWQINGRSDKLMHLNTEDDLYYVYNYSLWLDVKILFRTPWVVIRGKGAF